MLLVAEVRAQLREICLKVVPPFMEKFLFYCGDLELLVTSGMKNILVVEKLLNKQEYKSYS
jgi:hypothetical protein